MCYICLYKHSTRISYLRSTTFTYNLISKSIFKVGSRGLSQDIFHTDERLQ